MSEAKEKEEETLRRRRRRREIFDDEKRFETHRIHGGQVNWLRLRRCHQHDTHF